MPFKEKILQFGRKAKLKDGPSQNSGSPQPSSGAVGSNDTPRGWNSQLRLGGQGLPERDHL